MSDERCVATRRDYQWDAPRFVRWFVPLRGGEALGLLGAPGRCWHYESTARDCGPVCEVKS